MEYVYELRVETCEGYKQKINVKTYTFTTEEKARAKLAQNVAEIKSNMDPDDDDEFWDNFDWENDEYPEWHNAEILTDTPDEFYIWIEDDGMYHGYDDDDYKHVELKITRKQVQ